MDLPKLQLDYLQASIGLGGIEMKLGGVGVHIGEPLQSDWEELKYTYGENGSVVTGSFNRTGRN